MDYIFNIIYNILMGWGEEQRIEKFNFEDIDNLLKGLTQGPDLALTLGNFK